MRRQPNTLEAVWEKTKHNGGLGAVSREFTTRGAGDSRGVLCIVLVFAPDASPRGKRQKQRKTQHPDPPVPQGLWRFFFSLGKPGEPRSLQILRQPCQNASSRRELSIGASHELSFGECWKNHGKRITPMHTYNRGSGGPCLPGAKSGEPKRPRILRDSGQNAFSRRELSIGAPHARDTPSRSPGTFDGAAPGGARFTFQNHPLAPGPGRRES